MVTAGQLRTQLTGAAMGQSRAPVIVLTYAGSGAGQISSALSESRGLTCTSGTGLLPLCHQAVTVWQNIEGQPGGTLSRLAAASVKALSAGLMTVILARDGATRLCELANAPPPAAQTFLRLFPQTRFLIVHRRADAFLRAVLESSPWGLAGPEFAPFVSAYPASTIAALAAYWVTHTAALVDFEQAHQPSCLRVRIEDLSAKTEQVLRDIGDFIALDDKLVLPQPRQVMETWQPAGEPPPGMDMPLAQIPPALLVQLNELHDRLAYTRL